RARETGSLPLAADLVALLSERDLLRGSEGARDADIRGRIEALRGEGESGGIDRGALQRARRSARELLRHLGVAADSRARGGAVTGAATISQRSITAGAGGAASSLRSGGSVGGLLAL